MLAAGNGKYQVIFGHSFRVVADVWKKVGSVRYIAEMAVFLLSDKSGWITWHVYGVDGGISSLKAN